MASLGKDEEKIKKMVELRSYLEALVKEKKKEIERLTGFINAIDSFLVKASFQVGVEQPEKAEKRVKGRVYQISSRKGVHLGDMVVDEGRIEIIPSREIGFSSKVPPFMQFFVKKVLLNMKLADKNKALKGKIDESQVLDFQIVKDGEIIKKIEITNYREENRVKEILNTITWTFERMYEKTLKT